MGRPRDNRDAAQVVARELANIAARLASLKGEAIAWLSDERYAVPRHRLENATLRSKRRRWRLGAGYAGREAER